MTACTVAARSCAVMPVLFVWWSTHVGQHRDAHLTAPVRNHEIDDRRRRRFGRANEVSLIFAIFGVDHDDDFAAGDRFHYRFNRRILIGHCKLRGKP